MKRKGILYLFLGLGFFIWLLPWFSGFLTSLYIDTHFNPIQVNDLSISLSQIQAKRVTVAYGSKSIEFETVRATITPWHWLTRGVHIDELTIARMSVQDAKIKDQVQKSTISSNELYWVPIKHTLIEEVVIDGFSIGKVESHWHVSPLRNYQLTVIFHDLQRARLDITYSGLLKQELSYQMSVFDQMFSGSIRPTYKGYIWHLGEFAKTYPKGLLVENKNNEWVFTDADGSGQVVGRVGGVDGFVSLVNNNLDVGLTYSNQQWQLKIKSRHFEVDLKSQKMLEGLVKFNQYPFMDRLITGVVFLKNTSASVSIRGQLHAFHYQSKDRLHFEFSKAGSDFSGNWQYDFENGDYIHMDIEAIDALNTLLTQTGSINQTKFNAKQKIKRSSDVFEIEWFPLKYGNHIWQNTQKTQFTLTNDIVIKPDCFVNDQRGRICFALDLRHETKNNLSMQYISNEKIDLSDWLPSQFLISDLAFKGVIDIKYMLGATYPELKIDTQDISFKFDPLITTEIPMASYAYINGGKGVVSFKEGSWIYNVILNTDHGGKITLDSSLPNDITWTNLLSGYKEDTYLISNGSGHWNQEEYSCHIDIALQQGQINLVDYYRKFSNPVKVNRFNLPIMFSFQLSNDAPLGLNILGIEGQINVNLRIDEKESVWIANGDISMLPGGIFRKNVEPITIKEAKILYYNNDILDPFVQIALEKRQTLLTRSNQVSNYQDELLGVRIYGKLQNYQLQTYSIPAGINEFVILQTVLINPILYSSQGQKGKKDLVGSLAGSVRELRNLLPFDQITFRPAERKEALIDPYDESSTVSMMKKLSQSLGLYARIGSLPQDNIFSLIYRPPNRVVGTQLYSNYESQGINIVYSH